VTLLEPRFRPQVVRELMACGHAIRWAAPFDAALGSQHAIEVLADPAVPDAARLTYAAATDPRSEGGPAVW
jgi:hypothetical protein